MIECDKIKQELEALKMTFNSCTALPLKSMIKMADLMILLDDCKCGCAETGGPIMKTIYSFQFDSLVYNISNINMINQSFLDQYGAAELESELLEGKNITLPTVGRYGYVITSATDNPYRIFDVLNNDITDIVFDTEYDSLTKTYYYVSKEYLTPSSIYNKFTK